MAYVVRMLIEEHGGRGKGKEGGGVHVIMNQCRALVYS